MPPSAERADRAPLDWLNFLLADVQGGVGPFLAVFLVGGRHWDAGRTGLVLTIGGLATVLARAPAGALTDATRAKRGVIALGSVTVALAAAVMAFWPTFWPVATALAASGTADALLPVAIAAISLGIVGRAGFTARIGRNEAFNHAGNALTAIVAGLAGSFLLPAGALWIVFLLGLVALVPLVAVRAGDIDHATARGADDGDQGPSHATRLHGLRHPGALFAFIAAITLFHFANAAMLPLAGEELARHYPGVASLCMAACIITAQAAMVPMAVLVGARADRWGRKKIFLAGFAALPLRGVLFAVVHDPAAVVAVQLLDGVGAGIFGALFLIVIADLTEGTGHFNLVQGVAAMCWGLGAALSNGVAGYVVDALGYDAAFLLLAGFAGGALLLLWLGVPETRGWARRTVRMSAPKGLPVGSGEA